jgi:hypothetical protein
MRAAQAVKKLVKGWAAGVIIGRMAQGLVQPDLSSERALVYSRVAHV